MDDAQGSTNFRFALPHIRHQNRITALLRDGAVITMGRLLIAPGVAFVFVVGAVIGSLELIVRTTSESVFSFRCSGNVIVHSPRSSTELLHIDGASAGKMGSFIVSGGLLENRTDAEPACHDLTVANQDTWIVL